MRGERERDLNSSIASGKKSREAGGEWEGLRVWRGAFVLKCGEMFLGFVPRTLSEWLWRVNFEDWILFV